RSGVITTVAGTGRGGAFGGDGGPATSASLGAADVVVDGSGNLFIADRPHSRVRQVDATTGIITTAAGDGAIGLAGIGRPALQAHVNTPTGLALGGDGSLYIYDGYARIVKIDPGGVVRLVAGTGSTGYGGDGGRAVDAELPSGGGSLALDSSGDLFLTDSGSVRVREVHPGPAAPVGDAAKLSPLHSP
ncbi:MAG: hypothetical protein M3256_21705, partial [Actinomycetota bacterium]|nr:hypothetical protein [Actinomycetota bacterium]